MYGIEEDLGFYGEEEQKTQVDINLSNEHDPGAALNDRTTESQITPVRSEGNYSIIDDEGEEEDQLFMANLPGTDTDSSDGV